MKCEQCGSENFEAAKFCTECGTRLAGGEGAQAGNTVHTGNVTAGENSNIFIAGGNITYHAPPPDPQIAKDRAALKRYLEKLALQCGALPLSDLGSEHGQARELRLEDVYTQLDVFADPVHEDFEKGGGFDLRDDEKRRRLPAIESVANNPRIVLLGDPGSGKTSFVYNLINLQIQFFNTGQRPRDLPDVFERDWLPVRVILRDAANRLAALNLDNCAPATQQKLIVEAIREQAVFDLKHLLAVEGFDQILEDLMTSGRIFLVFDGLDEVPPEVRDRVRDAVAYTPAKRTIVTCRILSYSGDARLPEPLFKVDTLAPFNQEQIEAFADAWYAGQHKIGLIPAEQINSRAEDLKVNALRKDWNLREFAGNPMLLTTMAIVHQEKTRLPDERVQLYKQAVLVLLRRWRSKIGHGELSVSPQLARFLDANEQKPLLRVVEQLAYAAHQTRDGDDNRRPADLPRKDAIEVLEKALTTQKQSYELAIPLLEFIDKRAGLLLGRGGGLAGRPEIYSFPHRTFQEYLAGCYLLNGDDDDKAEAIAKLTKEGDYWHLAVRLAAEEIRHNSERNGEVEARGIASKLMLSDKPQSPETARQALWAGVFAEKAGPDLFKEETNTRNFPQFLKRIKNDLTEILRTNTLPATERAEAGRVLAELGDNRPGVGLDPATGLPDIAWCFVPGGPFKMGEGNGQHENSLLTKGYWLAQYPVTQTQFAAFVQAGGYAQPRYWGEAEAAGYWENGSVKMRYDNQPRVGPQKFGGAFDLANHPVVGVSWYEALAFARWLNEQYQTRLPAGYHITLPSEAEWEKAARGGLKLPSTSIEPITGQDLRNGPPEVELDRKNDYPARRYPWGDQITPEHANYNNRIGSTSAVGAFAGKGTSPFGCLDLSGNVWEWTRSVYSGYHKTAGYDQPTKRENLAAGAGEARVLRGGSWDNLDNGSRAAYRSSINPYNHDNSLGFRVCVPVLAPQSSAL